MFAALSWVTFALDTFTAQIFFSFLCLSEMVYAYG